MDMKNIVCQECGLSMEYWTTANFIKCTKCGASVAVDPCKDVEEIVEEDLTGIETIKIIDGVVEETIKIDLDYLLNKGIIFAEEWWTEGEDGDYWWEYYEDEECTKRIEDIDAFVEEYKRGD